MTALAFGRFISGTNALKVLSNRADGMNALIAVGPKTAYSYTSSVSQYWIFSHRRELDHLIYAPGFDFGYTGMFIEPYTGFYHTHYRDYDWRTHRWDREDSAGYVDGLNLYSAYFDVNGTDPTGLAAGGGVGLFLLGSWIWYEMHGVAEAPEGTAESARYANLVRKQRQDEQLITVASLLSLKLGGPVINALSSKGKSKAVQWLAGSSMRGATFAGTHNTLTQLNEGGEFSFSELGIHMGVGAGSFVLLEGGLIAINVGGKWVLTELQNALAPRLSIHVPSPWGVQN